MDVLKIVLTAIATVLAFYATTSMLLAQKQLLAATRLSGYLMYWQSWILERDLSKLYAVGLFWNQEEQEIRKRGGGAAELVKIQEERKKQLEAIKHELEKGAGFDKSRLMRDIKRHSKESILESSRITRQNLIDGKTFVSDEEAASLGAAFTYKCIELKMGILDLIDGATVLIIDLMNGPDDFEIKDYSSDVAEMIWKGILLSRNIDVMSRAAKAISAKSVMDLTMQNMITGKRLTKR